MHLSLHSAGFPRRQSEQDKEDCIVKDTRSYPGVCYLPGHSLELEEICQTVFGIIPYRESCAIWEGMVARVYRKLACKVVVPQVNTSDTSFLAARYSIPLTMIYCLIHPTIIFCPVLTHCVLIFATRLVLSSRLLLTMSSNCRKSGR